MPIRSCGGCVYSHIAYPRQLTLKSEIIRDAFLRLGRIPIDGPIDVAPSPERGYRMRARFHVDGARVGFYREGTHTLCDAGGNRAGQRGGAATSVASAVEALARGGARVASVELTENVAGRPARAVGQLVGDRALGDGRSRASPTASALTGCAVRTPTGGSSQSAIRPSPIRCDVLTRGRVADGALRRHAESFFQANRFLVPDLVDGRAGRRGRRRRRARPVRWRRPVLGRARAVRLAARSRRSKAIG